MRLFLAFIVVGAIGIGYVYNHQQLSPTAEAETAPRRPLFDWQSADDTLSAVSSNVAMSMDDPPLVVRDTINSAKSEITSSLDEFVRVNGESPQVPDPSDPRIPNVSDIVSQAALPGPENTVRDTEPVPFATSDDPSDDDPSDIETTSTGSADAATASNLSGSPETESPSELETAAVEAMPAAGKAAINEATLVTKKPAAAKNPAPAAQEDPAVAAGKPSITQTGPRSELLPGGKPPGKPLPVVDSNWQVVAKTTNGLPMHTRRMGRQGPQVFLVAGLDGRDQVAIRWNDELADELTRQNELLQSTQVLIFRAGNPDGLMQRKSTNPHAALINRNFPGRHYLPQSDKAAGTGPGSEAETQAIMAAMSLFQPRRVIHLASTNGQTTVLFNPAAKEIANDLKQRFQLNTQPMKLDQLPGSVEDFADGGPDAEVLTLKLSSGTDWKQEWRKHLPVVLASIQSKAAVLVGSPIRMSEEPAPIVKRRRGYEELPPPPR